MTFSIIAVCTRTGKMGVCKTSGTPLSGGRSYVIVPNKGVFICQSSTSFLVMNLGARLLEFGYPPHKVLKEVQDCDARIEHRQIGIVSANGESAGFTGTKSKAKPGWSHHVAGRGFVASGNVLAGETVVTAMAASFEQSAAEELEERLLRAVEAGLAAGGQVRPRVESSASLVVWDRYEFPIINLRVDIAAKPMTELRRQFDWYRPLIPFFIERNTDPETVSADWRTVCDDLGQPQHPYLDSPAWYRDQV